jgi:hypothetical protein
MRCLTPTVWLMLLAATSSAAAEIGPEMRVVIRTYDSATLAPKDLQAAVATAAAILAASDLELTWHHCDAALARDPARPCAAPLGVNEIAVRLIRVATDRAYRGDRPLGYSLVDAGTHAGSLATIYMDRVAWLSGAAGVDAAIVLGRAVAHEVGHLLLGTNAHSDSGLMRAVWSCDSLRRNIRRDWLFAPADGRAMRQAVRMRAVPQMARLGLGNDQPD